MIKHIRASQDLSTPKHKIHNNIIHVHQRSGQIIGNKRFCAPPLLYFFSSILLKRDP
ncbi:hypothetical protein Hanom_Chr16g01483541 [Helianthus anomalus]